MLTNHHGHSALLAHSLLAALQPVEQRRPVGARLCSRGGRGGGGGGLSGGAAEHGKGAVPHVTRCQGREVIVARAALGLRQCILQPSWPCSSAHTPHKTWSTPAAHRAVQPGPHRLRSSPDSAASSGAKKW